MELVAQCDVGCSSPAWDWDSPVSPAQPPVLPKSLGLGEDRGHRQAPLHPGGLSLGDICPEPSWFLGTVAISRGPL